MGIILSTRGRLMEVMRGRVLNHEAKDILNKGIRQGISQGIQALIETCQELNASYEATAEKLNEKFHLSDDEIQEYMEKFWK